ncbi:Splicing factor U2AF 59 kDa subunit [Wickerhamomyces ciferrii]|uniref:Splicing factor U2AF 59 kDa subunit n=1 Tax=Wickerhamomyces ciferrii (strain ATCC 14091 / BCRC 22168 / CBS 111 / JCM 3599 / NBRC 0793 / NRRL Y-1031 F-60-10) TaxID=1206466 RepID=K0KYA4_WICCF|nr:Splicing factor U2AF 59 kDa subunit [Wickerhamomyces ciferrii]CCH46078.1 Splicing factor U2AF 59 kDa subunit [Wickerhamomyces ciferrii]
MSTNNVLEALKQKQQSQNTLQQSHPKPSSSGTLGSPRPSTSNDAYSRRSNEDRGRSGSPSLSSSSSYSRRDQRDEKPSDHKPSFRERDSRGIAPSGPSGPSGPSSASSNSGGYRRGESGGYSRNDQHDRRIESTRDYGGRERRDYRSTDNRSSRYRDDRYDNRGSNYRYRERDTRDWRDRSGRYNGGGYDSYHGDSYRSRDEPDYYEESNYDQEDLSKIIPIDKLERNISLWDIKPKGFEKISSERAKISGLFPLPGERKRIDISKLQGLVKGGDLNSQTSILFEQVSIDSNSSRFSKKLVITGIEFSLFPVQRLIDYLTNFINNLGLSNAFIVDYELIDLKYLVIGLSNIEITTILKSNFKNFQNELNLKIQIDRPKGYITPIPQKDDETNGAVKESDFNVKDSEFKIAITNIPQDIKKFEIFEDLQEIDSIKAMDFLIDKDGVSKGLVFVEFNSLAPEKSIELINKIVINENTLFAFQPCLGLPKQLESFSYRTISKLVESNTTNTTLTKSKVLVILNAINPEDLKNPIIYEELFKDFEQKLNEYDASNENSIEIKIPKPDSTYKRNLKNLDKSVGKIFIKFSNESKAQKILNEINGIKYNERTLLVGFWNEFDFNLNLF